MLSTPSSLKPGPDNVIHVKIVLVGGRTVSDEKAYSCGKSSLVRRYVEGSFESKTVPTFGAAVLMKNVKIDGFRLELDIWGL